MPRSLVQVSYPCTSARPVKALPITARRNTLSGRNTAAWMSASRIAGQAPGLFTHTVRHPWGHKTRHHQVAASVYGSSPDDYFGGGYENEPRIMETSEKVYSFLTPEGVFQIREPVKETRSTPVGRRKRLMEPLPTWEEQGLCIASTFSLAATNGHDLSRRVIFQGYTRSVDILAEAVEDTVLYRGGVVAVNESKARETFSHALNMTVVLPFLWSGAPYEIEDLNYAIVEAGGIIAEVKRQWHII